MFGWNENLLRLMVVGTRKFSYEMHLPLTRWYYSSPYDKWKNSPTAEVCYTHITLRLSCAVYRDQSYRVTVRTALGSMESLSVQCALAASDWGTSLKHARKRCASLIGGGLWFEPRNANPNMIHNTEGSFSCIRNNRLNTLESISTRQRYERESM